MRHLVVAVVVLGVLSLVVAGCSKKQPAGSGTGTERGGPGSGTATGSSDAPAATAPAKVGQVKTGMTLEQVTAILGEPTTQFAADAQGKQILQCVWETDGATYSVQFHDGKAAVIHEGTEGGARSAADGARVKTSFSKVRPGMTEAEVDALLGPPTKSGGTAGQGMSMTVKTWEVGESTYTVSFMNGKVQMTHKDEGD